MEDEKDPRVRQVRVTKVFKNWVTLCHQTSD